MHAMNRKQRRQFTKRFSRKQGTTMQREISSAGPKIVTRIIREIKKIRSEFKGEHAALMSAIQIAREISLVYDLLYQRLLGEKNYRLYEMIMAELDK
jgi:hypothetical protein